jgi:hypothetical protein
MEDLGMLVKDRLSAMDSGHRETLLLLSASVILELVDGITTVGAERTEDNEVYIDAAPDVLPHQLFRILPRDLCVYLQRHREHLDCTFSNEEIETIGSQHKALYDSKPVKPM